MKRRVEAEQFYTDPRLAAHCVAAVQTRFGLESFAHIIEPSAGQGAFYQLLPAANRVGIDLHPGHPDLIQADFLTWSPPPSTGRTLIIGNPPFGQRAGLAMAFVQHAASFSDVIAMIFPRSFRKYTFTNRFPPYWHLEEQFDCDHFHTPTGQPITVKAVFQIWQRRDQLRPMITPAATHPDFTLRHAHLSRTSPAQRQTLINQHPFAVPQVGQRFHPRASELVRQGSWWFVQPLVPGVWERFTRLDFSFLAGLNTAHTSLSKRDIVTAYQAVCDAETLNFPA